MFASFAVCPLGRVAVAVAASRRVASRRGASLASLTSFDPSDGCRLGSGTQNLEHNCASADCSVSVPCGSASRMLACVALCHRDCCWAGRVGGAMHWKSASRTRRVCGVCGAVLWESLLDRSCGRRCAVGIYVSDASHVWRVWRCAMGIAARRIVSVALCHRDCCSTCCVGGAVPWELLLGVSRGWRCAIGIAARQVAWVALCHKSNKNCC